jgi:hypothetical protein
MSITPDITQVNTQIDAARQRWAERRAIQEQADRDDAVTIAALRGEEHQHLLERMGKHLPSWMLEYVQPQPDFDVDTGIALVGVHLPGCSPITVVINRFGYVTSYEVDEALRIVCDDEWWVKQATHRAVDLDEAIDLAASHGESWHEMQTEAARRNQEGIRPAPPPATPLDIARVAAENGTLDAATWCLLAIAEELHTLNGRS